MKLLLDSSTIIFDLILAKKLQGVVSEKAIEETKRMFSHSKSWRFLNVLEMDLRRNFQVIPLKHIRKEITKWKDKIKEKDIEHLATAKALELKYIIAFDRDFEPFAEYRTPKQFVEKELKMKPFETGY